MEKEVKIIPPEGYEIDRNNSSLEKIVFKKKENSKPRSWEEYCKQQQTNNKPGYYLNGESCRIQETYWAGCYMQNEWKNVLPSKELAEAFLAMMQLMSVREDWIKDWVPDYNNDHEYKWYITFSKNKLEVFYSFVDSHSLSFPTKEMAEDFMNCFKDLLEIAKPLI